MKARYPGLIYENTVINCEYNGQSSTILSIITTTSENLQIKSIFFFDGFVFLTL